MENRDDTNTSSDAKKYREYAAECRRMAQRAAEKDRNILMEIADAWIARAEETERRNKASTKDS